MNNAISWIQANIKLPTINYGFRPIRLYQNQVDYIKWLNRSSGFGKRKFMRVGRQQGYTSASIAYALYSLYNKKDQRIFIVNPVYGQSLVNSTLFHELKSHLPDEYLRLPPSTDNRLEFEIGSNRVKFVSANRNSTCGYSATLIILENYDYISDPDQCIDCLHPMLSSGNSKFAAYNHFE